MLGFEVLLCTSLLRLAMAVRVLMEKQPFYWCRWARVARAGSLSLRRGAPCLHLIQQELMLRVEGLKKIFRSGGSDLVLFENLSFQVAKGEMLAIVGES